MTRAEQIQALEVEVHNLKVDQQRKQDELSALKSEVPEGYVLVNPGEVVKEGALGFEPYHAKWGRAGNSVGRTVNEQGYVTEYTHRGWKYANPII